MDCLIPLVCFKKIQACSRTHWFISPGPILRLQFSHMAYAVKSNIYNSKILFDQYCITWDYNNDLKFSDIGKQDDQGFHCLQSICIFLGDTFCLNLTELTTIFITKF